MTRTESIDAAAAAPSPSPRSPSRNLPPETTAIQRISPSKTYDGYVPLSRRLTAVREQGKNIPKLGWNNFHQYSYVRGQDVVDIFRRALSDNGVNLVVSSGGFDEVSMPTKRCGTSTLITLWTTYRFEADDNPEDFVEVTWPSQANDTDGDKGLYKAMTNGLKYFLMQTFLVLGDDDVEKNNSSGDATEDAHPEAGGRASAPPRGGARRGGGERSGGARSWGGAKDASNFPRPTDDVLGIPFAAHMRACLRTTSRTIDDLRQAIRSGGKGDLVAHDDPAQWSAGLAEAIVGWVGRAMTEKSAPPPARFPSPDTESDPPHDDDVHTIESSDVGTGEPSGLPLFMRWPIPERVTPSSVEYFRRKLVEAVRERLAADPQTAKEDPEYVVSIMERKRAGDLVDASDSSQVATARQRYAALEESVRSGTTPLNDYLLPF